ncbi:hypothetical protein BLOT_012237 [Blomia tropicalis]|nr:hypothetical protein BLOT_012237 [Blomia tropicalis]
MILINHEERTVDILKALGKRNPNETEPNKQTTSIIKATSPTVQNEMKHTNVAVIFVNIVDNKSEKKVLRGGDEEGVHFMNYVCQ